MQRPSTVTGYKSSSKQYHPSSTSGTTFIADSVNPIPRPSDSPKRLSSSETQIPGNLISNHQDLPTQAFRPSRDSHYDQAPGPEGQPNPSFPSENHPRSREWPTPEMAGASTIRPSTSTGYKQDYAGKTLRHQGLSTTNTIESAQAHPVSHANSLGLNRMLGQQDNSPRISSRQHVVPQNVNLVKEEQFARGGMAEPGSQLQGSLAQATMVPSMQKKESPRMPILVAEPDNPVPTTIEARVHGPLDRPTMVSVMKKESPRATLVADSVTLLPANIETRASFHSTNKRGSPNSRSLKLGPTLNSETSNLQTSGAPEQKQESPASGQRTFPTPLNRQSQLPINAENVNHQPTKFIKQDSPRMHGEIRTKNHGVRSSPLTSRDDLQHDPPATFGSKYDSPGAITASRKQSNGMTFVDTGPGSEETHKAPTTGWSNASTAPQTTQVKGYRNLPSTGPRHEGETQLNASSSVLPGNNYSQHEQHRPWAPPSTDITDSRIPPLPLTTTSRSGLPKSSENNHNRFEGIKSLCFGVASTNYCRRFTTCL